MASDCPCCGDPRPTVEWRELAVSLDDGASWAGRSFHLSPQRLSLLHHLARRAPGVVCRDALFLSSLNEDTYGEMLTAQICLLNKALRQHGIPLAVVNQRAVGYRLGPA